MDDRCRCLWMLRCFPLLIAHLWKIFPLSRMLYGLEAFCLNLKDVIQLEQLQRFFIKRIQCLPINTTTSGLLGIRPIQQELDLRKLTLMGCVLFHKKTLEYEIVQHQLVIKSVDSKSWFAECNPLLYKYNLPNTDPTDKHIDSLESWKTYSNTLNQVATKTQNLVQSLKVGQIHQVWQSIPHDVRTVKRAYPKFRLLTDIYFLQENRAKFNQYAVSTSRFLCGAGAETPIYFIAKCLRLGCIRDSFMEYF